MKGGKMILLMLICFILALTTGLFLFSKYLRPRMISISQSFAENEISMIIDQEIQRLMLKEFLSYDKITVISRDNSGKIASISTNSVLINSFANDLDISIGDRIDSMNTIQNGVYLSSLIGADLFSGLGPKIPVRFQPVSITHADISHRFEEAGINQTLHTIDLKISVDIAILLPMAHSSITVTSDLPIAQTLIVGSVPDALFKK